MTRVVHPPMPVAIETDEAGRPRHLRGAPLVGEVEPVLRWLVDVDWWSQPVSREYWRVILRGRLMCEIFRDLADGAWYVERVYD